MTLILTHISRQDDPADFGWSDLGNWASLHDKLAKDSNANASVGNVRFFECSDCIVHVEAALKVSLQGLDGYTVLLVKT